MTVTRHSPLHTSVGSALTDTHLPHDFTLTIRIECIDHSRLLSGEQDVTAVVEFLENNGSTIVEVGSGAVVLRAAQRVPDIAWCCLLRPNDFAGTEFESEHGIAQRSRRCGVVVAGADVKHASLGIKRRRRPDAGAGWSPFVFAGLLCLFRNRVSLPDLRPILDAKRHDASTESTARILGIRRTAFFP